MRIPFWRRRREEELSEEINSHLRMAAKERQDQGESAEQAAIAAQRELGNVSLVKEVTRRMWGLRSIEILLQDVQYGLRMLFKHPAFAAIAVLSLALGIGANTAIFSVVNVLLFKPLPYPEPERLVAVVQTNPTQTKATGYHLWSYPAFTNLRAESQSLQDIAAYWEVNKILKISDEPEKERGEIVTANYFSLLGINASLGRTFLREEDALPNKYPVILLSRDLWLRRFGGDPTAIGKTVFMGKNLFTVVGVLPAEFKGQSGTDDFWFPMMMAEQVMYEDILTKSADLWLRVIARLKSGVTFEQARAELPLITPRVLPPQARIIVPIETDNVLSPEDQLKLIPLRETKIDPAIARAFLILLAAVGCVLLIACANTANLLLARSMARQREFAVRLALGAGRGRIVRQVLTESVLLSAIGGTAGLLVAFWGVSWLTTVKPWNRTAKWTPYAITFEYFSVKIDWRVLTFNFVAAVTTGIVFGLVPAWQSSRLHLSEMLKEGSGSSVSGFRAVRRLSSRNVLIITEIALSVVLLVGAGLMIKSVSHLTAVNLGFVPDNVATMTVGSGGGGQNFYNSLVERVRTIPGVQGVSLSNVTPLEGEMNSFMIQSDETVEDQALTETTRRFVGANIVTPDYFKTFRITTIKGRTFTDNDRVGTQRVAVVSRAMADTYWPDKNPIGKQIKLPLRYETSEEWIEVIGIVDDVKYESVEEAVGPVCYLPLSQPTLGGGQLSFRTNADPASMIAVIRSEIKRLNKNSPISGITTMQERTTQATSRYRYSALLMALFAGLALLLAAIGIYGVIGYAVSARTKELGIRIALGAGRGQIVRLIIGDGAVLIAVGLGLGLSAAYATTRLLTSQLYQVKPTDPFTFVAVTLVLASVAFLACYLPSRRASRVDPMVALRYE